MNTDKNINPLEALAAVFGEPKQIADGITAFGDVVYSYTRKQAISATAEEVQGGKRVRCP